MSIRLVIDLLPSFLTNHDVATLLAVCPGVLRSGLIVNADGRSVGSAVIEVSTPGDAWRIIQTMDGVEIAGTAIRVSRLEGPPQERGGEHEAEPSELTQCGPLAQQQSMVKPSG